MKLLKSVSQWAKEVFYLPSITQATSQMLNFVIMSLVGPKSLELQVSNPEKLAFKPVSILQDVITMLTSLGSNQEFSDALVLDERSFKIEYYQKAMRLLKKQKIFQCLPNFQALIKFLCQKNIGEQEELLGDPPEQFVCPLSCDLMKEPVFVKTCQKICQKAFIKRIILNDGKDPYNRMPLSQQDLEQCVELKARIQKWIQQKLAGQVTDEDLRIQKQKQEQAENMHKTAPVKQDAKMQVERSAFDDDDDESDNKNNFNQNNGSNQFGLMTNQFQNLDDEMDADLLMALQLSMNDNNNNGQ